jgi:hypothetical protein
MPLDRLRLEDMSDRVVLLVLDDVAEGDGWADSLDVARTLGLPERRFASTRLSWLQRFGAVEREHERDQSGNLRWHKSGKPMFTQRWRLTDDGRAIAHGALRKGVQTALDRVDDAQLLVLTRWLVQRPAGQVARTLTRREWQREMLLQKRGG